MLYTIKKIISGYDGASLNRVIDDETAYDIYDGYDYNDCEKEEDVDNDDDDDVGDFPLVVKM